MSNAPDTFVVTGAQFVQTRSGDILVTPFGGNQTTLALALAGAGPLVQLIVTSGVVTFLNLPTSDDGLETGRVWNNGGFLCVVP